MQKARNALSLVLALIIAATFFAMPVSAAELSTAEYNQAVQERAQGIQTKYGITVTYPSPGGRAAVGTGTLATLDTALGYVTADMVKQISSYYQQKNGTRLQISYTVSTQSVSNEPILAAFDDTKSLIEAYIPASGQSAIITGNTPVAIVHELGHAFHLMVASSYGYEKMRSEWTAFNGGISYAASNIAKNPDSKIFASGYAATSFDEDVAETFAYAFNCGKDGMGLSSRLRNGSDATGFGRKVAYIDSLIANYITSSSAPRANIQKIYTAASSIRYKGGVFSGSYLEYIGCNAPNGVLSAVLRATGVTASSSEWDHTIGGWYVKASDGKEYVMFPGGYYANITGLQMRYAA